MRELLDLIADNPALRVMMNLKGELVTSGTGAEAFLCAAAFIKDHKTRIVVKSNLYEAQQFYEHLKTYLGDDCALFIVDETCRFDALAESPEMLAERLNALEALTGGKPVVVVTHTHACLRHIVTPEAYLKAHRTLRVHDQVDMKELAGWLTQVGYRLSLSCQEPFEYARRGGIIDVYSGQLSHPVRLEFFGDEIDSIRYFDENTQRTISTLDEVTIIPAVDMLYDKDDIDLKPLFLNSSQRMPSLENQEELWRVYEQDMDALDSWDYAPKLYKYYAKITPTCSILDYCSGGIVLFNRADIKENAGLLFEELQDYVSESFDAGKMPLGLEFFYEPEELFAKYDRVVSSEIFQSDPRQVIFNTRDISAGRVSTEKDLIDLVQSYLPQRVFIVLDEYHLKRVSDVLGNMSGITLLAGELRQGLELGLEKAVILSNREIFGEKTVQRRTFVKYKNAKVLSRFEDLQIGDYIVHDVHGIGQYQGIRTLEVDHAKRDYLYIAYRGNDVLYIPVEQFSSIRKYTFRDGAIPRVNKLGSTEWAKTKRRVKQRTDDIAAKLVEIYAARMASPGFAFLPDSADQVAFEEQFGYELTPDQETAIAEIKEDMEKPRPMDRLLCGDVGFGKTEVALRAAFKAIYSGRQVAFLCPTTILSSQHYRTAIARFENFPVNIAVLNRYVSGKQVKDILARLKSGSIDLLIGTHRILSNDVEFKNLGLLIVDEEQRFGVRQKEKIKDYKKTIDVLTLTATPIPRTLQMSLMGIRQLSTIDTPPKNRYPVQTYVVEKSPSLVKQVIERELARGGQVFYLYNRTEDIDRVANELALRIPGAKIGIGHGKMDKNQLEGVMQAFIDGRFNILVCTTIIETGIDIPNANTILVENADHFGLAQLYQIRGRVGRSDRHAYAYLMHRPQRQLTEDAVKRLRAIREFTELGSGYKIAVRDLSIRGAGDILGGEQAGFIDSVGFDMFMKILQESIAEKMGTTVETKEVKSVAVHQDGYIPPDYVESDLEKLHLYQKLQGVTSLNQLDAMKAELEDLYGHLPKEIQALLDKRELDILASQDGVASIQEVADRVVVSFTSQFTSQIDGEKLLVFVTALSRQIKIAYQYDHIEVAFPKQSDFATGINLFLKSRSRYMKVEENF